MTVLTATATLLGAAGAVEATQPVTPLRVATGSSGPREPATDFRWPMTRPHRVVRGFDPPATDFGSGHRGVDLAGRPGQPVLAAGGGVVVHAGPLAGRGVVSVEHPNGLRTTYEPVTAEVSEGQRVTRGQRIGRLAQGHPECAAQAPESCLHWGVKQANDYLDPLWLLGRGSVRLLPWRTPTEP